MRARGRALIIITVAAASGCGGSAPALPPDATAADWHPDAAATSDVGADATPDAISAWPDVLPGTVLSCDELPRETGDVLLAGAFTALSIEPAPLRPPTGDFQEDVSGVLSADALAPGAPFVHDDELESNSDRFAVTAKDGRRLTVSYEVEFGRDSRPLAAALRLLDGHEVSLRYVARRPPDWSTGFVVADRQGIALAFDTGRRGHTLTANDLGGLAVEPGRPWCSAALHCPGEAFLSLRIAAATDVEIPPTEERLFSFGGGQYTAANIRHDQRPTGCGDGFFWAAWALWRR